MSVTQFLADCREVCGVRRDLRQLQSGPQAVAEVRVTAEEARTAQVRVALARPLVRQRRDIADVLLLAEFRLLRDAILISLQGPVAQLVEANIRDDARDKSAVD